MTAEALNILVLGGCRVRQSSRSVARAQDRVNFEPCGPVNGTNTPGEMMRSLAYLRGELTIPDELRSLCHMLPAVQPMEEGKDFSHLDAALVEISTPVELVFRDLFLSQYRFRREVLMPLQSAGMDAQLLGKWFTAFRAFDEGARRETSAEILRQFPATLEQPELLRALVSETRSQKVDIAEGLERVRARLGCQIAVVLYIFRYMPDGRQIDWPPGFLAECVDAAKRLGLPTYDPTPKLLEFGVGKAFRPDQEFHYARDLLPIMGLDLIQFSESICGAGAARNSKTSEPILA